MKVNPDTSDTNCFETERRAEQTQQDHYMKLISSLPDGSEQCADLGIGSEIHGILDSIPFHVLLVDRDYQILLANEALRLSLGSELKAIIGTDCADTLKSLYRNIPRELLDEAIKRNQAVEHESYDEMSGRWVLSAVYPTRLKTKSDQAIFFHMIRDITAEKQIEDSNYNIVQFQRTYEGTVNALASIVEKRDPYTAAHQRRVAKLACLIAREMGLNAGQVEAVRIAATLHDIGKISSPAEILSKPSPLAEIEFIMIKNHPKHGYDILKMIEFPWPIAQIVMQHHERMDGSGYPSGLHGQDVLLEARILAVADVTEAMASHRPYRPALGVNESLDELIRNKGTFYDTDVVEACLRIFERGDFCFD